MTSLICIPKHANIYSFVLALSICDVVTACRQLTFNYSPQAHMIIKQLITPRSFKIHQPGLRCMRGRGMAPYYKTIIISLRNLPPEASRLRAKSHLRALPVHNSLPTNHRKIVFFSHTWPNRVPKWWWWRSEAENNEKSPSS
jgi:hypothetical protein